MSANADGFYSVLDGEADMLSGEEVKPARRGHFVFIPRGVTHSRVTTSDSARFLYLRTPGGFERILALRGQRTDTFDPPPLGWTASDLDLDRRRRAFDDLGIRDVAVALLPNSAPSS